MTDHQTPESTTQAPHTAHTSRAQAACSDAGGDERGGLAQLAGAGGGDAAAMQAVFGLWTEAAPSRAGASQGEVAEAGIGGAGMELPERAELERGFGTSFGTVRLHANAAAARACEALGTEAFACGEHIAVAKPGPSREVLAHELAHVIQQRSDGGPAGGVGQVGDAYEQEAKDAAATVAGGGTTALAQRYAGAGAARSGQRRGVQRYESGEHAMLGGGPQYPFEGSTLSLPNGAQAMAGDMVALGDFFASMQQIAESPRQETEALIGFIRLEALWYHARRLGKGPAAMGNTDEKPDARRLAVFQDAEKSKAKELWDMTLPGQTRSLDGWRTALFNRFSPAWEFFGLKLEPHEAPAGNLVGLKLTLGRRRFRGNNDTLFDPGAAGASRDYDPRLATHDPAGLGGDYQDQAANNLSHFAPDSWETWKVYHARACQKHRDAKTPQEKEQALAEDLLGCHYLTDRFSAGHTVNKEELMAFATSMMLKMAGQQGQTRAGKATHQTLGDELDRALRTCFADAAVAEKWDEGVERARFHKLVSIEETKRLKQLPKTGDWAGRAGVSVASRVRDVIMGMPWRNVSGTLSLDAESRNTGPASTEKGRGDYHLGVGNLAALQVHDALNAIGFQAKNAAGKTWRMQGDDHLTVETQALAHEVVRLSQAQVEHGAAQPEEILPHMPSEGVIDPQWVRDRLLGGEARFDRARIESLCRYVAGRKIPLGVQAQAGKPGKDAVSPEMTEICHRLMETLFLSPNDETAHAEDLQHSGLNISMLKSFLMERLPEMVSMSYVASSAADVPQTALEQYAPRTLNRDVLPRAVRDWQWQGDDAIAFRVNVSGCEPGSYHLGVEVRDRDSGYDVTDAGVEDRGMTGIVDADALVWQGTLSMEVPPSSQPATDAGEDASGERYVMATLALPPSTKRSSVSRRALGDDRYVVLFADPDRRMRIGRSHTAGSHAPRSPRRVLPANMT